MGGAAMAVIPGVFSTLGQQAYGAPVCAKGSAAGAGAAKLPGYLHVELSGGPALSGNFMIGKQAAGAAFQPLAAAGYQTLGVAAARLPGAVELDKVIKGQFHPDSQFLAGMKSVMSTLAMSKTVAVGIAGTSADDNANNPLNPVQLSTQIIGNPGGLVQIVGTGNSAATQGRTAPLNVAQNPGLSKANIANEGSLSNLVNPGLIATRFGGNTAASVATADLAHKLTASKLAVLPARDLNQQVKDLVECGYIGAKELLTAYSANNLTPTTDQTIAGSMFNAIPAATLTDTPTAAPNSPSSLKAIIMGKLLADGLASGATIELGGYDYHGQGRATQNAKDFQAGQTVGLALEVAHRKGAPLFVAVTADGSVSSGNGTDYSADNGSHGAALMIAIGSAAIPATTMLQIGKYADSGAVDTGYATVTSGTPAGQALCIAYNYAAFAGRMTQFEQILATNAVNNPFKGNEATYLAFAPKA